MKNKKLLRLASLLGLLFCSKQVEAFSQTNFTLPHEGFIWQSSKYFLPDYYDKDDPKTFRLNVGASLEYGWDAEGRNKDNKTVDAFSIYSDSELFFNTDFYLNSSGTLKTTLIALGSTSPLAPADIDSNPVLAGSLKYKPKTTVSETDLTLRSKLNLPIDYFPGQIELEVAVPVKFVEVSNVSWKKVPAPTSSATVPPPGALYSYLASHESLLLDTLKQSTGFKMNKYSETNIGDTYVGVTWKNHYTQVNDALSSVGLLARIGLSLPTSKRADLKEVLAIPFGNQGSLGVPMGGAINLNFAQNFRISGAASVNVLFSETSDRYLPSKATEGGVLFGKMFHANRDPGITMTFNGLAEVTSSCKKYAVGAMYEFIKKNADKYTSNSKDFNPRLVNNSEIAQEKSAHNVVIRGNVDFREMTDSEYAPMFSASFKYPLKAQRMIVFKTFTLDASISF